LENAGRHEPFEQHSKRADWKLNWQFKYIPRDNPQHNQMAKYGFAVINN